jgi:hypothetical protein
MLCFAARPQGAYLTTAMYCMGSSAVFHLVGPVSRRAYDTALRCDITGIAIIIAASFFVGLHYGYWCARIPARITRRRAARAVLRAMRACECAARRPAGRDRSDPAIHSGGPNNRSERAGRQVPPGFGPDLRGHRHRALSVSRTRPAPGPHPARTRPAPTRPGPAPVMYPARHPEPGPHPARTRPACRK